MWMLTFNVVLWYQDLLFRDFLWFFSFFFFSIRPTDPTSGNASDTKRKKMGGNGRAPQSPLMVQCLDCYELCELNNLVWSWPNTINKILKCQKEGLNTVTPSEKWPLEMYPLLNLKRYLVEEQTGIPHSDPLYMRI